MLHPLNKMNNNKIKTMSQKVNDMISYQNVENSNSASSDESTDSVPKVVHFDDDYELPDERTSEIRKRNIKLLSEQSAKYKGEISSRKSFEEVDDGTGDTSDSDDMESDDASTDENKPHTKFHKNGSDSENELDSYEELANDNVDSDEYETSGVEENNQETEMLGKKSHQEEIQKGLCVKNQLHIWEKLLQIRIQSQKLLSKANMLPDPKDLQHQQEEITDVKRAAKETQVSCSNLLNQLLQLQTTLYNQYSEIVASCKENRRKRAIPPSSNISEEPTCKRFALLLEHQFDDFKPYRNAIFLKWDDRIKLLTPGAGSKKKVHEEYDILKKIENALLNRKALIDKSHILQSRLKTTSDRESDSNGESCDGNQNAPKGHVYDDTDFYHQQLREFIEYKSSGSTNNSGITKQLLELQKLRQKMKKKVDTRASKGRKIRYNVHKKLINFMAPHDTSSWKEESKDELYKSLFSSYNYI